MKKIKKISWLILILIVLTACNYPSSKPGPVTPTVNMVQTAAAATIAAIHTEQAPVETQGAVELIPSNTPPNEQPANTQAPDEPTLEPTEEIPPTSTPWPTYTPLPTFTPYPTNTPTPTAPCNQMQFIRDVTIPDLTWMRPEQPFTKIWEIQNTGSCTWDSSYSVVYGDSGGTFGASASKALPNVPVNPGGKVQIAIGFTAPNTDGEYTSVWKLQPDGGSKFGSMNVQINVDGNPNTIYFTDMLCSAEWRNGTEILPCPNEKTNPKGSMYIENNPKFETGYTDDETAIIMIPQQKTDGEVKGTFFYIKMPANPAHFVTLIGCTKDNEGCDADIFIYYRVKGSDTLVQLGAWDQRYDNSLQNIDIDLNGKSLEGKEVEFTFLVKAAGPYTDDEIFFLLPRIYVP